MKITATALLFFFILAICTLISCSKATDQPNQPEEAILPLITRAPWVLESIQVDLLQDGTVDASLPLAACERDNLYFFSESGSGKWEESKIKCDETDPFVTPFSWSIESGRNFVADLPVLGLKGSGFIQSITYFQMRWVVDSGEGANRMRTIYSFKH
jgi:hypothetical protein